MDSGVALIDMGSLKLVVDTEDVNSVVEFAELFASLANAENDVERIAILKELEAWTYRYPKEVEQIRKQVKWRFEPNA